MKKSNIVVFAIIAVISIFLLWLWYYLGFDKIDNPLDLVLSIVWWIGVALLIGAIAKVEQTRRERIRTCYVASNKIYNSERGTVPYAHGASPADAIQGILVDLKYGFDVQEMPSKQSTQFINVVRTTAFKAGKDDNGKVTVEEWKGNVSLVMRPKDEPMEFQNREQLEAILAGEYTRPSSPAPTNPVKPAVATA